MKKNNVIKVIKIFSYYFSLCLFICILMKLCFNLPVRDFFNVYSVPLSYSGDTLGALVVTQNFISGGDLSSIINLGAPIVWNSQSATLSLGNIFLLYIGTLFTDEAGLIVNMLYLLSYPVVGITSAFVLRKLHLSPIFAFAGGSLYAFLPFHYMRNVWHLWLSLYYLIPLIMLVVIWMMQGKAVSVVLQSPYKYRFIHSINQLKNKKMLFSIIICFLVAFGDLYYAFFSIICITFASIYSSFQFKKIIYFIQGMLLDAVIACGVAIQLIPFLLRGESIFSSEVLYRGIADAEVYSLKIVQMLIPVRGHRISLFAHLAEIYNTSMPLVNENATVALGVIISIGFISSLFFAIILRNNKRFSLECDLGNFNIFIILVSSIGGFGVIISLVVTSAIRCYNRLSIFVAFTSILVLFLCVERLYLFLLRKFQGSFKKKVISFVFGVIILLLTVGGVYDQVSLNAAVNIPTLEWENDENFIKQVELSVDQNAMIFELPTYGLQGGIYVNRFLTYDILKPFLHSTTLQWSASYSDGDICDHWNKYISSLSTQEMIDTLCYTGFNGIYIDSYAYTDTEFEELTSQIEAILGNDPIISENGRLYFYNTVNYKNSLIEKSLLNKRVSSDEENQLIQYFYGWGDSSDGYKWTTDNTSNILCVLPDDIGNQITLTFDIIVPTQTDGLNLTIYVGNTSIYNVYVSNSEEITLTVPNIYFTSSDLLSLTFYCDTLYDNSDIILDNNEQPIGIGIKSITISEK